MTVQEIRIGNFLNLIDTRGEIYLPFGPVKVYRFNHESICFCDISDEFHKVNRFTEAMVFEFEPIPITEKWLSKFGFKEEVKNGFRLSIGQPDTLDDLTIYIDLKDNQQRISLNHYSFNVDCKYVHSLQNLFYCLAGKELEIKEQ